MDLVKLETARQFAGIMLSTMDDADKASLISLNGRSIIAMTAASIADELHKAVNGCSEAKGHPAECALEQLFDLLNDHPDKAAFKWIRANAKLRGMKELCAYLGAERE